MKKALNKPDRKQKPAINFIIKNKFLIFIFIISALLMFSNLGNRWLQADEAVTALVGLTTLENGYPKMFYNNQIITYDQTGNLMNNESNHYESNENYVPLEQPWLSYYVLAASFGVLGKSSFAAKLPFAIAGFALIFVFYFFSRKLTSDERAAKISTLLLATSVMFYLYSRQSRYFALIMLFTVCLLYSYVNFLEERKCSSVLFVLFAALLFYSHYGVFLGVFFGVILHFLFFRHYKNAFVLKKAILSSLSIFLLTFPWYYLFAFSQNASEMALSMNYFIYAGTGIFYLFIIFGFPLLFVPILPSLLKSRIKERCWLLILPIFSLIMILSLHSEFPQTRYMIALLPMIVLLTGLCASKILRYSKILGIIVIGLLVFTNILVVFPLNLMQYAGIAEKINVEAVNLPYFFERAFMPRFHLIDYAYELTHDYDSAGEMVIKYMAENGNADDRFIVRVPGISMLIRFYTGMGYAEKINEKADWIILWDTQNAPSDAGAEKEEFMDFLNRNINWNDYEKIELRQSNVWSAETPDPIHHKYKSDRQGTIVLYHLK